MSENDADPRLSELPPEIWRGLQFTGIQSAMVFADLENSVLLSSIQRPNEYQRLVDSFQSAMLNLVWQLEEMGMAVGEYHVAGDQLSIFFYDPVDVWRNYQIGRLDEQNREIADQASKELESRTSDLSFMALKAAIQLKSLWLAQNLNLSRIRDRRDPIGLGIGIHVGPVHLCMRADGRRRIEGFAVNKAKRVESTARYGSYSRLMLSREIHDSIRSHTLKHTLLRQRIFFHRLDLEFELLKGLTQSQPVFELKFYSRLELERSPDVIGQYDGMFELDPSNIWAYYELFDHYAYVRKDWDKVFELAKRAQLMFPDDEKVLLDLSRYYARKGSLEKAIQLAEQAVRINDKFDLAYEHLASLAEKRGDSAAQLDYLNRALGLAPGSPVNNLNFGLTLLQVGNPDEGAFHILEALRLYPEYVDYPGFIETIAAAHKENRLPDSVLESLATAGHTFD